MDFDLIRIVFMAISILIGQFIGGFLASFIGLWGALIGGTIVGVIIYYVYSMLVGQKTFLVGAICFGILNYIATLIMGFIGSNYGFQLGLFTIAFQAGILSLLWGWLGGKAQPQKTVKAGLSV